MEQFIVTNIKTKEERFVELMGYYHIEISCNSFPTMINFYDSNKTWLISYHKKSELIKINYSQIWVSLYKEYDMSYFEIKKFIKYMLIK